ncbi:MAG: MerR family transcriptional regulator [Gordonia sp. (in: high G+C Gram-positive bacteria)]
MLIGELAERSGTTRRALRYYEQQHLLEPTRDANGYRRYEPTAVVRVHQIRALLDAGFSSDVITRLLPCTVGASTQIDLCPAVAAEMRDVLATLEAKMRDLDRQRQSITRLLAGDN